MSATPKKLLTRQAILDAALRLFLEKGVAATTMRAIAKEAGLSAGAAYYHFESKEHIIHAFYEHTFETYYDQVCKQLVAAVSLEDAIRIVLEGQLRNATPYHAVSRELMKVAVDPESPLSPLSEMSAPLRHRVMDLYAEICQRWEPRATKRFDGYLPSLLWLYHMSMVAFWLQDTSEEQGATFRLVDRTVNMVVGFIRLSSLPPLQPMLRRTVAIAADLPFLRDYVAQQA